MDGGTSSDGTDDPAWRPADGIAGGVTAITACNEVIIAPYVLMPALPPARDVSRPAS